MSEIAETVTQSVETVAKDVAQETVKVTEVVAQGVETAAQTVAQTAVKIEKISINEVEKLLNSEIAIQSVKIAEKALSDARSKVKEIKG